MKMAYEITIFNYETITRLTYIFLMCILIRCIKTIQNITQIAGQKFVTAVLIALDTVFFLLIFKTLLTGDLSASLIFTVSLGFIVGYYIGSYIEEKMALGKVKVTIKVAKERSSELFESLNEEGFIFTRSTRHYTHRGKLRKYYEGIIYRKELPKLKETTKGFNALFIIENIKDTFGKKIFTSKEYLTYHEKNESRN